MRSLLLALLMLILATLPAIPSRAAGPAVKPRAATLPAGTLSADQVKALFVDKTVTSVTVARQRQSISYYAPDGGVRQISAGISRLGRWRVTDNGRMCLQMESMPEKCRIIVNDRGIYKKYIVKKNGRHEHTITYQDFRTGNPLGL